jgi:hypothetical protein
MHNRTPVIVWQQGEIIDYDGRIEAITENAVQIDGARYLKETCEIKVRQTERRDIK